MYRLNDYRPNTGGLIGDIWSVDVHPQNTIGLVKVLIFIKLYLPICSSGEFAKRPRLQLKQRLQYRAVLDSNRPNRSKSTLTKSYSTLFLFLMADFSFLSTFQYALKAHCDTEDSQQGFINRVIPFQIFPNPVTPMVIRELSITFYFKRQTRICIT